GPCSLNVVLIVEPRFTGSDHVEKCAVGFTTRFAVMLRSDCVPQARSASEATAASVREVGVMAAHPVDASTSRGLARRDRRREWTRRLVCAPRPRAPVANRRAEG